MDVPLELIISRTSRNTLASFNPCFNGCASRIRFEQWFLQVRFVSILVLMDVPLELVKTGHHLQEQNVSILVLMDVPLEWYYTFSYTHPITGFNPCFNGCASRINLGDPEKIIPGGKIVSILVLMDVPLELI